MYFLFMSTLVGLSFVNQVDYKNAIYFSMAIWLNLMLFRYFSNRIKMILSSYAIALSFCVYVNFAHLLANPMMWVVDDTKEAVGYLLGGNYNQMGCRMMIAVLTNWMCVKFSRLWMISVSMNRKLRMTPPSTIYDSICISRLAKLRHIFTILTNTIQNGNNVISCKLILNENRLKYSGIFLNESDNILIFCIS